MATALRKSKSFQKNLFFSIGGIFLLFAVCFSVYQYQREKEYKIDIKMRVTIIDTNGLVLQDNNYQGIDSLPNHLKRVEVQEALAQGNGYDIKRTSESTHETYFYSATRFGDLVVRSAVPYSAELTESLKADNTFIYFTIALTLLLAIALYLNTRRISRHIGHLREFAIKAEEGKELDHELERRLPDDEYTAIWRASLTIPICLRTNVSIFWNAAMPKASA